MEYPVLRLTCKKFVNWATNYIKTNLREVMTNCAWQLLFMCSDYGLFLQLPTSKLTNKVFFSGAYHYVVVSLLVVMFFLIFKLCRVLKLQEFFALWFLCRCKIYFTVFWYVGCSTTLIEYEKFILLLSYQKFFLFEN